MLVVFSALALGACDKCDDSPVDIGLLSYEKFAADYEAFEKDNSCPMVDRKILFKLTHLTDGTLGFMYEYACWVDGTGYEGGGDQNLPFASSCEDPMWTREGGLKISSTAYKSDRHCFEPLLDSEIPKTCPACDDTGVDIGYLKFKELNTEMDDFDKGCVDDTKTYLTLQLTKNAENKYALTYTISCWTSDGVQIDQVPQSKFLLLTSARMRLRGQILKKQMLLFPKRPTKPTATASSTMSR